MAMIRCGQDQTAKLSFGGTDHGSNVSRADTRVQNRYLHHTPWKEHRVSGATQSRRFRL